MEKIIYAYTVRKVRESRWRWMDLIYAPSYPVRRKENVWCGYELTGYEILLEKEEKGGKQERIRQKRWERTMQRTDGLIAGEEVNSRCEVFREWELTDFPQEMALAFYNSCMEERKKRSHPAEQLIVIENGRPAGEILEEIYPGYNYITVLTDREDEYEDLQDMVYEDSGLMVRCTSDSASLQFLKKSTVVLDLGNELPACYKNLPANSIYLCLSEGKEKKRKLQAKCRGIKFLSLGNTLDTILRNTV